MNIRLTGIASITIIAVSIFGMSMVSYADSPCTYNPSASICGDLDKTTDDGANNLVRNITSTLLYVVGMLSVAMIIYSGIRYVTAHGDKGQVEKAKNTLIYSITGLVVSLLAYAIINFVLSRF